MGSARLRRPRTPHLIAATLVVALASVGAFAGGAGRLGRAATAGPAYEVASPFVLDASGRHVFFHGMNVVYKTPPYYPPSSGSFNQTFAASDADFLAAHGFNAVRLGVLWAGVEPQQDQFDDTYLANIASIVSLLQSRGIAALLDFHQDMMNEEFQGEGFPAWAVHTEVPPTNCCGFPGNYFTPAVMRAFDNVWVNAYGLWDAYAKAWEHVAGYFAGTANVVGYDLFNEPWPGSQWETCANPAGCPAFDTQFLQPFYEHVIHAIRKADSGAIVWWEPNVTNDFATSDNVGLVSPLRDGGNNNGISFHDYCLVGGLVPGVSRGSDPECPTAEALTIQQQQPMAAARNHSGLFLTEFGASDDLTDIGRVTALADSSMDSWFFWQYKSMTDPTGNPTEEGLFDSQGNVKPKITLLERTYPTAVAGTPRSFAYDPTTKVFTLTYDADPSISAPTDIFVPVTDAYGGTYTVTVTGPAGVTSGANAAHLTLQNTGAAGAVTVTVNP